MIKKLFLALVLFSAYFVSAQNGSASPYSFYGLGDFKFKGTNDYRQMGGLSVSNDSIRLNLLNPASYSNLKYTNFAVGATTTFSTFATASEKDKAKRTTLDYLAVGLPLGKFGASFGIMPFTSVGYKVQSIASGSDNTDRTYMGEGGINRVFTGLSYKITNNFSIGADFQYNFGDIETESVVFITDIILGTRERNTSYIRGTSYNFGALYNYKIKNNLDWTNSFTYSPSANFKTSNERNVATVSYNVNGTEIVSDQEDIEVADSKLKKPATYSFGSGIGKNANWFVGIEYTFQENSNLGNRFNDIQNVDFEDSKKYIIGGFYIPKINSFTNYWDRVTYRAGFRYENTGLKINNQSINDYGMNFGLGLPVGGRFTTINVGFEFGKKGTTSNNLIEENYFNINIGLSLNDLWFEKRKYD